MAQLFQDTVSFDVGGYLGDPGGICSIRRIPGAPPGVNWVIDVFTCGKYGDGHALQVYLRAVGACITVTGQLEILNYAAGDVITKTFKFEFVDGTKQGFDHLAESGIESVF